MTLEYTGAALRASNRLYFPIGPRAKTLCKPERPHMGWSLRIAIAIVALLILGAAALAIYAGTISPPHRTYEQVIPNDRFAS
ncbi:MAG TPA: hypothetical protein VHU23_06910 [Rhizomicrobium sp.]|nr:hypothetical protein [Rhizomicrobium sp.]